MKSSLPRWRLLTLLLALLLIVLSWCGIAAARNGLLFRSLKYEDTPMLFVAPQDGANLPGVLVAHGFAGSKQLMLGYAHVLARGGYAVLLWDFRGHGANPIPFPDFAQFSELQDDLEGAFETLVKQPEVDPTRLAVLGHSMGSSVVMNASIARPKRYRATVAVSPIEAPVTPLVPANLQLQAGRWEGMFVAAAERLLLEAGGESPSLADGRGRSLVIVPRVEHITILFSHISHQAALEWLNDTFDLPLKRRTVDRRFLWYGLHLTSWLAVLGAISPVWSSHRIHRKEISKSWLGLGLAPLAATGSLMLLSRSGVSIPNLGGLLVGGALGLWFLAAGLVWLGVQGQIPRLTLKALGLGLALFLVLWIAFGAMAQVTWLSWWLLPVRFPMWLALSGACLPWFLAAGIAQNGIGVRGRVIWWLAQSAVLIGGLLLTIFFLPQLGFLVILLPIFPLLWIMFSWAAAQLNDAWSCAIGSSLFFGWLLAAAFPLVN